MTVIIEDQFSGMSNGDDISGRTPDTTNTPGNTWEDTGTDDVEGDGSNQIKCADNQSCAGIDTGETDHSVEVEFNAGGADNRGSLGARASGADANAGTYDGYQWNWRTGLNTLHLIRTVNNSDTQLGSDVSFTINSSTTYAYKLEVNGSSIKGYVDDSEKISETDSGIDGSTNGGSYAGFHHRLHTDGAGRFDNFIVDDLAAGKALAGTIAAVASVSSNPLLRSRVVSSSFAAVSSVSSSPLNRLKRLIGSFANTSSFAAAPLNRLKRLAGSFSVVSVFTGALSKAVSGTKALAGTIAAATTLAAQPLKRSRIAQGSFAVISSLVAEPLKRSRLIQGSFAAVSNLTGTISGLGAAVVKRGRLLLLGVGNILFKFFKE